MRDEQEKVAILIVDDRPADLAAVSEILQSLGETIVTAGSGEEALRQILTQDFAVILLDIMMPRMNGYELAAVIRGRESYAHTPIIFLTATYSDEKHVLSGYEAGAVDYLYKPVKPYMLQAKVSILIDLHRQTAALKRANDLLKEKSEGLDTFAHSAAHDLITPVRHIQWFSKLLMEECAKNLSASELDYLTHIVTATHEMSDLIDTMIKLAGMRATTFRPKKIDLTEIARDIIGRLREREEREFVTVTIPQQLSVEADPDLIRILLNNLIGNAWKFTGKCVKPEIEVGMILSSSHPDGEKKTYFVKDNGVGFDMKYATNLFQPFRRLHGKSEFPGSGVGLATVHRIIERHGGKIWAEAEVGWGATFYFTLE
jgi:signal transduction histidine kinase